MRIILVAIGCLHLCGGHYGVLQAVAWSKMLVDYTASDGFLVGARKTFDGQHPCCLCKSIASSKKQEHQESPQSVPAEKNLGFKDCPIGTPVEVHPPGFREIAATGFTRPTTFTSIGQDRPPLPPPRGLA